MKTILIHNPRCSKSREALKLLSDRGLNFDIVDYLKDGLKEKLLANLPGLLNLTYPEMIRTKEELYKELNLANKKLSDNEWIETLSKHPVLLERPILIHNGRAVIGRPIENFESILQ